VTRRILVIALAAAAVFAAILGAVSTAQDTPRSPTPESSPSAAVPSPVETTIPAESPAPTETAVETPAQTETPAVTPPAAETSTPAETTAATPAPTASATETPAAAAGTPAASATPAKKVKKGRVRSTGTNTEEIASTLPKCSTSTSGRECDEKKSKHSDDSKKTHRHVRKVTKVAAPQLTTSAGAPAPTNPTYSLATPGPAPIGVPNFFIDKFRIPPFLLPIYQAAGTQYGIRWEVLAAINEIETDYGRNLNISSAGALGWMQFMPATWKLYGVDANKDGQKDPFNPVDAIFAAARYLKAAGGDQDIKRAIFAYNHADWYVDSVLLRAQVIGGLPSSLVGSLTGLTQGRFPVHAKSTYAGQLRKADRKRHVRQGANAAVVVESDDERKGIEIFARKNAPVVAVNDGRITRIGQSKRLGRFVKLLDVYGNTYTYAHLGSVAKSYPTPKKHTVRKERVREELRLPSDRTPKAAASETRSPANKRTEPAHKVRLAAHPASTPRPAVAKERLFANPERPRAKAAGGAAQLGQVADLDGTAPLGFAKKDFRFKTMHEGARVIGGTVLGRIAPGTKEQASHLLFEIRPAGRGAPRIDPKPVLDGWKLLESTAIYRAAGKNPFFGEDAEQPSIGQILLMSKETLSQRVLADPRIDVYGCGRQDIRTGQIDRRVLATLEFLATSGLKPTVSSLKCGHGFLTTSGNVSEHTTGTAVDIAAVNGVPIIGHQGPGSITDITIQRLLTLQGTMKPHQIISLMTFKDADNTLALPDHDDHIHVGWRPLYGQSRKTARKIDAILRPRQWIKLIDRLGEIDNPEVREAPSKFSVRVTKNASSAHEGE
jgi:murein DD-endopeptidase MepM/ murein hydrolase activator NlpD